MEKLTHMVHVVGAIIIRDGLILAAQRGVGRQLAGMWEFPGGKVETGEAPATALAREIREELNMDVRVDSHFDTTIHSYPFARVTLDTYFAEIASGTPVASEHAELRWCTANDLEELIWAPADVPAVHKLLVMLRARELLPPQR
ncbi:(deoxy)nucleoside triphosphate pyrophosphohydrolase [Microbacterium esteraromaticum]|uniref:(deoxy)nucleoside triphosphate pyrophosphohydrolase n=1 Tax=Microbacterium esteraromaticum TaxID=57043 RepID=UPI0019D3F066|nr:(deoxy)nucleoside triphosphate pyrophosphohydrolase [Microbacterium esteraromaticum]MBN7793838.1 (deoxy)nucleoside triphosphate pyrophosphohydrolase [Microbacterium esteraromaticum]